MNSILTSLQKIPAQLQQRLGKLQVRLPHIEIDRTLMISLGLVVLFALANVGLFLGIIAPGIQTQTVLATQVEQERTLLLQARRLHEESPSTLQARIQQSQAVLDKAPNLFLAENQVNDIVSAIYQNAALSGIALTDLTVQSAMPITPTNTLPTPTVTPPKPTPRPLNTAVPISTTNTSGTPAGTNNPNPTARIVKTAVPAATPVSAAVPTAMLYHTTTLHVQAKGPSQRLVNFLARMQETGLPGVVVNTLDMTGEDQFANLSLALTLYSSALVDPSVQTAAALPQAAPRALSAEMPIPPAPTPPIIVSNAIVPPQAKVTPTAQHLLLYIVQNGDTLFTLAKRYGVPAQLLVNANALTVLDLSAGQRLLIPIP